MPGLGVTPATPVCETSVSSPVRRTPTVPWASGASQRPRPAGSRKFASRSASTTPTVWPGSTARRTSAGRAVGQTATVPSARSAQPDLRGASGSARTGVTSATTVL